MKWQEITEPDDLQKVKVASKEKHCIIFKHSTRCATSFMTLQRLERNFDEVEMAGVGIYKLDVIAHRQLSNLIEDEFSIRHESPQLLVIENQKVEFHCSHFDITYDQLREAVLVG